MWTTSSRRTVYENAWISVHEDDVIRPDGTPGIYGVVQVASTAVFVIAVTDAEEVVLITVHRYPTGRVCLEIPAGGSDGDEPLVAAQRELREETGLAASRWRSLGQVDSLNGIANAPGEVFLATGLSEVGDTETEIEGITGRTLLPLDELPATIAAGAIIDNETLGALLLGLNALGRLH